MLNHSRYEPLVFVLILATAIFFRFYQLDQTPPGLYPDEAMNGVNALQANATGEYKIFYPENTGREGLFINIQALSVKIFGNHPWALRGVSAMFGVLTVIGLYFLTRALFQWRIAAFSSFIMAISFWHVNFSRIGFRAIMVPFILVWLFFFLWRGLQTARLSQFFWAGVFGGLGFYTYLSYRIVPLIVIILFLSYWKHLKDLFSHDKYEHARHQLVRGFALMMLVAFFIALPLGIYFLQHPNQFFERSTVSVFAQASPLKELANSIIRTLGMFNFSGDWNQRHNVNGMPLFPWPLGIFFLIGFIKDFIHWVSKKHGHYSPLHTFLFSWFFIMLLPGFLSVEAPHALRTIGAIPIVMIFAGRGLWWAFEAFSSWRDLGHPDNPRHARHLTDSTAILTMIFILLALGIFEFNRYFRIWAKSPITAGSFNQNYADLAKQINALPNSVPKYIIVKAPALLVQGIPVSAATVIFLTDTATPESQAAKHITYLLPEQAAKMHFPAKAKIFTIE